MLLSQYTTVIQRTAGSMRRELPPEQAHTFTLESDGRTAELTRKDFDDLRRYADSVTVRHGVLEYGLDRDADHDPVAVRAMAGAISGWSAPPSIVQRHDDGAHP